MAARPALFKVTDVKRAVTCALSLGLKVTGYEIGRDGSIRILTGEAKGNDADAELESWMKRNG